MGEARMKVEGYLRKNKAWGEALSALRAIVLECGLTEDFKWRNPVYTLGEGSEGKNVVFLGAMKECCVISFIKGALMKDEGKLLELPGPNTRSARVIRFTSADEVSRRAAVVKAYVLEAMELEKSGAKVVFDNSKLELPAELEARLKTDRKLRAAWEKLTPGRRRGYVLHFAGAKQAKTREARIEKCAERILAGKGMLDE
jgi:uncharacterized protein YdeI (YjbR/CyaY-like superfamily)